MATAAVPRIGDFGQRLDLEIRQGCTFGPYEVTELDEDDDSPVDITGSIYRGYIRKSPNSPDIVAEFDCYIVSAAGGAWAYKLSDEVTAAIVAGNSPNQPESRYTYDIEREDASGDVRPRLYGNIFVLAENTRP